MGGRDDYETISIIIDGCSTQEQKKRPRRGSDGRMVHSLNLISLNEVDQYQKTAAESWKRQKGF
jgi:hypothetical protein